MPGQIASEGLALDQLSDRELQRFEIRVRDPDKNSGRYVPAFPLIIQQVLVQNGATSALPLVLAMHRQLSMTGRGRTPLNAALWAAAGSPSPKERGGILKKLRRLPVIVEFGAKRTPTSHYELSRGSLWSSRVSSAAD